MNSKAFSPYDPFLTHKYLAITTGCHIVTHMKLISQCWNAQINPQGFGK